MRKYRKHGEFGKSRKKGKQAFLLHIVKQQQTVNYEKTEREEGEGSKKKWEEKGR